MVMLTLDDARRTERVRAVLITSSEILQYHALVRNKTTPTLNNEAEYISAVLACVQVMYMQQTLKDFRVYLEISSIFCDNTSAINLSKNSTNHCSTNILINIITFYEST
jgi:hypothetical protein